MTDNELMHYGMPRRSGRYPWGSGKDPYQRTGDFLGRIDELKKQGWTETPENIMKEFTNEYQSQSVLQYYHYLGNIERDELANMLNFLDLTRQ